MTTWTEADYRFMTRALRLAEFGAFGTHPNPRVGCVLVKDGRIIGEGWHRLAGEPHAEIHALADAGTEARGATAYVSLEPCSHFGRTAPCADALIEAGVSRVVAATEDPFPEVAGRGLARLRDAGLTVESGLLAEQAEAVNVGFFRRLRTGRPWVRVKLAASLDGRTALRNGESRWITSEAARDDVQRWRARSSVILTGIGTVRSDDPRLDVRLDTPRQPGRVIVDPALSLSRQARLLQRGGPVTLVAASDAQAPAWMASAELRILRVAAGEYGIDLGEMLSMLATDDVNEIHVEAGERLCGALLRARLVDELVLYLAPHVMGPGRGLFDFQPLESMDRRINFDWRQTERVGEDLRIVAVPHYPSAEETS